MEVSAAFSYFRDETNKLLRGREDAEGAEARDAGDFEGGVCVCLSALTCSSVMSPVCVCVVASLQSRGRL